MTDYADRDEQKVLEPQKPSFEEMKADAMRGLMKAYFAPLEPPKALKSHSRRWRRVALFAGVVVTLGGVALSGVQIVMGDWRGALWGVVHTVLYALYLMSLFTMEVASCDR